VGEDDGALHLFRDVTQKKENEQLLRQVLRAAKDLQDADLSEGVPPTSNNDTDTDLTQRELEVLSLLAQRFKPPL
jgi:ATP/maltotriose-dependent transcriptional regulator MalT